MEVARLPLIGLLASYCSRRIYQGLQAPVRPVRHACRFLRNREEAESTLDVKCCYATLKLSLLVNIAHQYCPGDPRCLVRQSDCGDTHVTALHHSFDPSTMPVVAAIYETHHCARTLYKQSPEISVAAFSNAAQLRLAAA